LFLLVFPPNYSFFDGIAQKLYVGADRCLRHGENRLKTKLFAVSLLLILSATAAMAIMPTRAQGEGYWITSYTITSTETQQVLMEVDFATGKNTSIPIVGGTEVTVTFTVNVFTTGSGNLKLATNMQHSKIKLDRYWELVSTDYALGSDFNPNSASTEFNWVKGTFTMICYGKTNVVTKPTALLLVGLYSSTGDPLDSIKPIITTAGADQFQTLYNQKEDRLQSLIDAGVAEGYVTLYSNVLNQSKNLVNKGYVNDAINLLNSLPNSGEPMGSALEFIMLPGIAIAAIVAVVFAVMFLRARGKNSYVQLVIEDQIKDLEGLTLRASKIDRTIASNLDGVKDRLKRLVGM